MRDVFACGQAYVALSRVRKLDCCIIRNFGASTAIKADAAALQYYQHIDSLSHATAECPATAAAAAATPSVIQASLPLAESSLSLPPPPPATAFGKRRFVPRAESESGGYIAIAEIMRMFKGERQVIDVPHDGDCAFHVLQRMVWLVRSEWLERCEYRNMVANELVDGKWTDSMSVTRDERAQLIRRLRRPRQWTLEFGTAYTLTPHSRVAVPLCRCVRSDAFVCVVVVLSLCVCCVSLSTINSPLVTRHLRKRIWCLMFCVCS